VLDDKFEDDEELLQVASLNFNQMIKRNTHQQMNRLSVFFSFFFLFLDSRFNDPLHITFYFHTNLMSLVLTFSFIIIINVHIKDDATTNQP